MAFSIWHGLTTYYGTVYVSYTTMFNSSLFVQGLSGPIDSTGLTYQHWFTSCLAFSLLIHIVTFKLFVESVYWNWIMTTVNIGCLLFYYSNVLFGNMPFVANIIG